MRSIRIRPLLGLILGLSVAVSCTTGDFEPTGPSTGANQQSPVLFSQTSLVPQGAADRLLACTPQKYLVRSEVVGRKGGEVQVGKHVLRIPAGALSRDVRIVAEQITGSVNSVRFSPEGLKFARPAALTLSYDNCATVAGPKGIVYTTERLSILEPLFSLDYPKYEYVTSPIEHFSRYAVAY
ncbi:MAG: hypothetical protein ACJ8A6_14885 [Gemmatimonadales bacterium]